MPPDGAPKTTNVAAPAVVELSAHTSITLAAGSPVAADMAVAIAFRGSGDPSTLMNRAGTVTATENKLPEARVALSVVTASCAENAENCSCTNGSNICSRRPAVHIRGEFGLCENDDNISFGIIAPNVHVIVDDVLEHVTFILWPKSGTIFV